MSTCPYSSEEVGATSRDILSCEPRSRRAAWREKIDMETIEEELLKGMYYTRGAASTTAADEGEQHEVGAA